jgi:chorismate--pyruvate lyase
MKIYGRIGAEPVWRPAARLRRAGIPERFFPWLFDSSSLTQRLQSACAGRFRVQVIRQSWAPPMRNEARALGVRPSSRALVRQVYLLCDDVPWVYARTVIPRVTLSGRRRRLARLRSRSLGAVLFADPTMERGAVELAALRPGDRLFDHATHGLRARPDTVWGRRALFRLGGRPLLVCEFFLPDIAEFPP